MSSKIPATCSSNLKSSAMAHALPSADEQPGPALERVEHVRREVLDAVGAAAGEIAGLHQRRELARHRQSQVLAVDLEQEAQRLEPAQGVADRGGIGAAEPPADFADVGRGLARQVDAGIEAFERQA